MKYKRFGIILCTEKYSDCVSFYSETLELPVSHVMDNEHSKLTILEFGEKTYLMIEGGGLASPSGKRVNENPVWLRFNVESVEIAANELKTKGVDVNIRNEVWGIVGDFIDPDGNRCSFREESSKVIEY